MRRANVVMVVLLAVLGQTLGQNSVFASDPHILPNILPKTLKRFVGTWKFDGCVQGGETQAPKLVIAESTDPVAALNIQIFQGNGDPDVLSAIPGISTKASGKGSTSNWDATLSIIEDQIAIAYQTQPGSEYSGTPWLNSLTAALYISAGENPKLIWERKGAVLSKEDGKWGLRPWESFCVYIKSN